MGRKDDEKRKLKKNATSMSQDIGNMFKRLRQTADGKWWSRNTDKLLGMHVCLM